MDDDIPRGDCRQRTTASKVPAHQKLLTVDSDDREHATDSEPESVPITPVVSPSRILEQKPEPPQKVMSSSSEPVGRPLHTSSPVTDRKPKWIPPAASGSSNNSTKCVSVKSPTQCLRLGLSRLARVKPLHPSATSS
ncbi:RAD51-associated protein 1 [Buceros rhinoceros silvestris]|uniref:RAD51-associated protein 1 n=1 Tax=Buceros rhinoceros silvestris TaxID=175836 RepID=A0A091GUK0_BUCRH|nr:RAD51-associated protein 1 [Buceros rhinoceros silvestris]